MSTSFFLSRRSVRADAKSGMPPWQDRLASKFRLFAQPD